MSFVPIQRTQTNQM